MPPKPPDLKEIGLRAVNAPANSRAPHPVRHLAANEGFLYIPVEMVRPNPDQPRQHFDDASLEDLTASVREKGVLQPVLIRKEPQGEGFILIAGERRLRAAKAAGLKEIPALMRAAEDALEVALIENVQRENLSAVEEAEALLRLKNARHFTDAQLAKLIGKSRQAVNDSLTLNSLPEDIKAECRLSGTYSKSQLLQLVRAGLTEETRALWHVLKQGPTATVRTLRERTAASRKTPQGRPRHFHYLHKPKGRPYQVLVTFAKARATSGEVRAALKDALKHAA